MQIRSVHLSSVALVMASLLLTSCSGDSDADDAIAGVETEEESESPRSEAGDSSEPTGDGVDRPRVSLPDDMNNVFEDTETGNPEHDAILQDVTQRISATDMAIAASDPNIDAVEFYNIDQGLITVKEYIRGGSDYANSWAGTAEYYDFTVETPHPSDAIVTYCIDSSGVRTKELDTGELWPKPEDARNFNYTQLVLQQNELGVWQVSYVMPREEQLDRRCER